MKLKYSLMPLLFTLVGFFNAMAQENTLSIPDLTVAPGKTISLPVNIDNTTDIVAVEFTLTVPQGITIETSSAALTERGPSHSITMMPTGQNKYKAMIFSTVNSPLSGRAGSLMTVDMSASTSMEEGATLPLTLTDVVLADINGDNIITGFTAGNVTMAQSPDLEVTDVTATAEVKPGDIMSAGWKVSNVGGMISEGGWREDVSLETEDGLSRLIYTAWMEEPLGAGASISRNIDFMLPATLLLDGKAHVKVSITPVGEKTWLSGNNSAVSASEINVGKLLYVNHATLQVTEEDSPKTMYKLTRSGSVTNAETFAIECTPDSRVDMPDSVTIPQGESESYFYVSVEPNKRYDDNAKVTITLGGNGYEDVTSTITIVDDVLPDLEMTYDTDEVTEGGTFALTFTTLKPVEDATPVTLTCEKPARFIIPSEIIIPAGEKSVTVRITAKDDQTPDLNHDIAFTAYIPGYNSVTDYILLIDNDMPALSLELTPDVVSEGDGPLSVAAVLSRTDNTDKRVTIQLSDDSDGGIFYGRQTFEMLPGVDKVVVNLGPIDNDVVDGERTYNITAAVYVASCSCSAADMTSGGFVMTPLTVQDNDGPTLSLTARKSVINEGGELSMKVRRNTEANIPLDVALSSDHDADIEYPAAVTIPAGEMDVEFTVKAKANSINGDGFNVIMTAEVADFAKGVTWFTVTDQTLPDAKITSIEPSEREVVVGNSITLDITVANDGVYELPEKTPVTVYSSLDRSENTVSTTKALAPGDAETLTLTLAMPAAVGTNSIYAIVNESHDVKELVYSNNASVVENISVLPPFTAVVSVDKAIYSPGEKVFITGKISGVKTACQEVEVYVINDGYRQAMQVVTDEEGNFTCDYTPYNGQTGHFSIGACYPGENIRTEFTAMDIYGFRRPEKGTITWDMTFEETVVGTIEIVNTGVLEQSNIKATVTDKPDNCDFEITGIDSPDGGKTYVVHYKLTGRELSDGTDWEKINIRVSSDEGGELNTSLYYYTTTPTGRLQSDISSINTTVTKGTVREYPLAIMNNGKGDTGKITLSLPNWISTATPKEMASLAPNESAEVILRISTEESMDLNMPITGKIAINCETGKGLVLPFTVTPVSETTGTLSVDVCDEYSYYTPGSPHVAGAKVILTKPYTGETVAEGVTGVDGKLNLELPEGYYSINVTADNHASYSNMILVDPGTEKSLLINLSVQGITVDYNVVETEVEDEYEFLTTLEFQTDVPVPVVELIMPKRIEAKSLAPGESLIFHATLTNHGMITAKDVELLLPSGFSALQFEALCNDEPFDLAPQQSVQIPVRVTHKLDDGKMRLQDIDNDPCVGQPGTLYFWDCGLDRKWHRYHIALQLGSCNSNDPSTWPGSTGGLSSGPGGSGSPAARPKPGMITYYDYQEIRPATTSTDEGCEPCQNSFLYKMTKCFVKRIPIISEVLEWVDDVNCSLGNVEIQELLKCVGGKIPVIKEVLDFVDIYKDCIVPLFEDCNPGDLGSDNNSRIRSKIGASRVSLPDASQISGYPSYVQSYLGNITPLINSANALNDLISELYDDECWSNASKEDLTKFAQQLQIWNGDYNILLPYKPASVTEDQLKRFVERWINTISGNVSDKTINMEIITGCHAIIQSAIDFSVRNGYGSLAEMLEKETNKVMENLNTAQSSVCSSVTLQFSQSMVMTRQAFRGTLKVGNGHESLPMENVTLTLTVTDEDGKITTAHEFQINAESLNGFEGELSLEAGWKLGAGKVGTATVLFIPTKYAAPTEPKKYNFAGFISFVNPFTGYEEVRSLSPVTMTVSPSPNLDFTYFMQRDVIGDDPLTVAVEPSEEAEFALLINNIGYGDAQNVRMITRQPEIIDNEKGLAINFELVSSQLNGGDKNLTFGGNAVNDFGNIPAKTTAYAQWWIKSNMLGHFTSYDVTANHVTSYGNEDLTLLNDVTIHELIRSLDIDKDEEKSIGFLVNDLVDADDTPDMLYLTNGDILPVAKASRADIIKLSDTSYCITVAGKEGWTYGNVNDPTYGMSELLSVVRKSDGKKMPLRNFWLTDRTLRDGKQPLYENRIHFADEMVGKSETYVLTFEPMPDIRLAVASIEGVPAEGTVVSRPVQSVNVMFNKHIDPSTFTHEDISLSVQGEPRYMRNVGIFSDDNKTFTLDFSALNDTIINGFHLLTIQTADITDREGYKGKSGREASWIMFLDNLTKLNVKVEPQHAGNVIVSEYVTDEDDPEQMLVEYGKSVDLQAMANRGYKFMGWTVNGDCISAETILSHDMIDDFSVTAVFDNKTFALEVDDAIEGGEITGTASGVYGYGETVSFRAVAEEDFSFSHWIVNGEDIDQKGMLEIDLYEDAKVSAAFNRDSYKQPITVLKGWNWISSFINEAIETNDFATRANRILGQFSESILDPEYGMVGDITEFQPGKSYKVEGNISYLKTVRGRLYKLDEKPMELHAGWNWIAYPYFEMRDIQSVIVNPTEGDFISTQKGFTEYSNGYWQGSVNAFEPGVGYLYKSAVRKNLNFNFDKTSAYSAAKMSAKSPDASQNDVVDIYKYPNTMNITASLYTGEDELLADGYTIYAMSGNECRGLSVRSGDNYYITVYGEGADEISFVVENEISGDTFLAKESLEFRNDVVGNRNSPFHITIVSGSGVDSIENDGHKMHIYTPTGILISRDADMATIKSLAPGIYIIDGKKVLVK